VSKSPPVKIQNVDIYQYLPSCFGETQPRKIVHLKFMKASNSFILRWDLLRNKWAKPST